MERLRQVATLALLTLPLHAQWTIGSRAFGHAANGGYAHVRSITLDHTQVGGSDSLNFPGMVTTNADILGAAITSTSATSATLTYGKQIQSGDYIQIDAEIILVNTVSGTSISSMTRAQKGTSAATHLTGQVVNDQWAASSTYGGSVTSSSGYDVTFSSDSAGNSPLQCEIIAYAATGAAAWAIKEPTMSHTSSPVVYVSYGNSGVTTNQCTAANVWSNGYVSVYHFGNGSSLSTTDSVGNNNGTNHSMTAAAPVVPTSTAAPIIATAGGSTYNATATGYIDIGTATDVAPSTLSVEAWTLPINQSAPYIIVGQISGNAGYEFFVGQGNLTFAYGDGTTLAILRVSSGCCGAAFPATYVGTTLNGTTAAMYVSGSPFSFSNIGGAATGLTPASVHAALGSQTGGSLSFGYAGNMQEVRISNVIRSADYFTATYNAWGNPYNFETIGVIR